MEHAGSSFRCAPIRRAWAGSLSNRSIISAHERRADSSAIHARTYPRKAARHCLFTPELPRASWSPYVIGTARSNTLLSTYRRRSGQGVVASFGRMDRSKNRIGCEFIVQWPGRGFPSVTDRFRRFSAKSLLKMCSDSTRSNFEITDRPERTTQSSPRLSLIRCTYRLRSR